MKKSKVNCNISSHCKVKVLNKEKINYLLHLPNGYYSTKKKYPLILFLHGMGERGNDLQLIKIHGLPKLIEKGKEFPFIILSPQCPEDDIWSSSKMLETLNVLTETITKKYRVKKRRCYLTGLSMGGFGSWALAANYPDKFAAVAPICGGTSLIDTEYLTHLPIWAFHGKDDKIVPPEESKKLIKILKRNGNSNCYLTIYKNTGHDSWSETYKNPGLYKWFLKYKLKKKKSK